MNTQDPGFLKFVEQISPPKNGIREVFLPDLLTVLKLLWEIYTILKSLGFFSRWLKTRELKRIMANNILVSDKEKALAELKSRLGD